jgi:tetratricopeptide (TPR) repeat protein
MKHSFEQYVDTTASSRAFPAVLILLLTLAPLIANGSSVNRNVGWPGTSLSENPCFGKAQGYGPYDYITERHKLGVVEAYHFTPEVENLIRGKSASVGGDLDYTLRAFPNHHRALWAMTRLYLQKVSTTDADALAREERAQRSMTPPECYFQRAKRFAPKDGIVSGIYGIYLHKRGRLDAALQEYKIAESLNPEHAEIAYNTGLLYADMNDVENARKYAERAERLGYPLKGLRNRIAEMKDAE